MLNSPGRAGNSRLRVSRSILPYVRLGPIFLSFAVTNLVTAGPRPGQAGAFGVKVEPAPVAHFRSANRN
jgi:hypothetical protein